MASPTVASLNDFANELSSLSDWFSLCTFLEVPYHDLKHIENFHYRDGVRRCLIEAYNNLEKQDKLPTWKLIIEFLRGARYIKLANEIEGKFVSPAENTSGIHDNESLADCTGKNTPEIYLENPAANEIPYFSEDERKDKCIVPLEKPSKGTELSENLQKFCKNVAIIIQTVKNNEQCAVLNFMKPPELCLEIPLTDKVIDLREPNSTVLGMFGGYRCAMIQTEMGPDGRREIENALEEFPNAQLVLALGIAYAFNPEKVKLGDVLVSKVIDGIGNIKYSPDGKIICRASKTRMVNVLQFWINVFARGDTWSSKEKFKCTKTGRQSEVHSGLILSYEAVINNSKIRDLVESNAPEPIGGEMEGVTLVDIQQKYAKSQRNPRIFGIMVIKGVADFGDEKKNDAWQFTAAMAATNYAHYQLKKSNGKLFD